MDILKTLNWRYATKRMNGEKVSQKKVDLILDAIRLSASSAGLQPYTILIIENPELREKIKAVAYNQPQITEASHLLVFAAWSTITTAQVDEYINQIATERNTTIDSLKALHDMLLNTVKNNTEEQNFNWAARQAYIALGTALVAAASEEVDSTPMEGFDAAGLDKLLGLEEQGLKSLALLPLGYRDNANDWLANLPKVRRKKEKLFILK